MTEHSPASDLVISVRGLAYAEAPAETATVSLAIVFDGDDRTGVRARSTAALAVCVDSIAAMHDAAHGPVVEWSANDVQVWADRPWSNDGAQQPLVYHSQASLSVTFSDVTRLSTWLEEAAGQEGTTIGGIEWAVTDLTRRELESRAQRDAVAHAVEKASVYAASLGRAAPRPLELTEPSVLSSAPSTQENTRMFALAGTAPVDLSPSPVRITVEVHARFSAPPA